MDTMIERIAYVARRLRTQQRLTQAELGTRAGLGRGSVSQLERGNARLLRLGVVEAIFAALDARLDLRVLWHGPELDRLLDAGHSAMAAAVKERLAAWGWVVKVEVSYSRYGERGRIDLLAWHPALQLLLVVEIKTDLVDVQDLLGTLDAKTRLARHVIEQFGWDVRSVIPAIVFAEDKTTRNRIARIETLFDRFSLRGRAALSWLRHPADPPPPGMLWFVDTPVVTSRSERPRVRHASSSR